MSRQVVHIPARRGPAAPATARSHRLRLAAYCRVSTDQEDQLQSFENQKTYFEEYASRHPEYILAGLYADEGISGTNTRHRDDFNRMIADCEAGKIDVVITKSISRFARNTADCLMYARKLKDLGIAVIFEKEGINTMDGSGELLFTILSSLAQEESRSISENTTWGIRYLFTQGVLHLNTNRFLGYDKDKDGNLIINQEQAEIVRYIYTSFLEGNGPGVIARRLREAGVPGVMGEAKWCASTIQGILVNEKYSGDALLQKTYPKARITCATSFTLIGALAKPQDQKLREETDLPALVQKEHYDLILADPLYQRTLPNYTGTCLPLPHPAVSGFPDK